MRFIATILVIIVISTSLIFAREKVENEKLTIDKLSQFTSVKPSWKIIIPGVPQYMKEEKGKAYSIWILEGGSLMSTAIFWILSNYEYDNYLELPEGISQEKFDKYYNNSNRYGTISLISVGIFGGVYFYSIVDATLFSKKKNATMGLNCNPYNKKVNLSIKIF
jgi:hypothetical protein